MRRRAGASQHLARGMSFDALYPSVIDSGRMVVNPSAADGLGACGEGPHALHEHVVIKDLAPRAAIVAGVLARLGGRSNVQ